MATGAEGGRVVVGCGSTLKVTPLESRRWASRGHAPSGSGGRQRPYPRLLLKEGSGSVQPRPDVCIYMGTLWRRRRAPVFASAPEAGFLFSPPAARALSFPLSQLQHQQTKFRLHSHDVAYGSGSGQQSVTAYPESDDPNSFWVLRGTTGAGACKQVRGRQMTKGAARSRGRGRGVRGGGYACLLAGFLRHLIPRPRFCFPTPARWLGKTNHDDDNNPKTDQ